MKHMLFAVFESPQLARAALAALEAERAQVHGEPLDVTIHGEKILHTEDLPINATNARRAFLKGIVLGALGGAVLGVILKVLDLIAVPMLPAIIFTAFAGGMFGALGAVLTGASDPDHRLEELIEEQPGSPRTVLYIEVPDLKSGERADALLRRLGADVRHKPVF